VSRAMLCNALMTCGNRSLECAGFATTQGLGGRNC